MPSKEAALIKDAIPYFVPQLESGMNRRIISQVWHKFLFSEQQDSGCRKKHFF